jgi:hypothetical protein
MCSGCHPLVYWDQHQVLLGYYVVECGAVECVDPRFAVGGTVELFEEGQCFSLCGYGYQLIHGIIVILLLF